MKRFYKIVTSAPAPDGGFVIHLDGKPVRIPSGGHLTAPTQKLADAIAAEWIAQKETIDPEAMPLTQITTTATGGMDRATIEKNVLAYLNTDLICYRAESPEEMAARQAKAWDQWIGWFERQSGTRLATTTGLAALTQKQEAHNYAVSRIRAMNDLEFTAMQIATATSGSLVLALAFMAGDASTDDVFAAAQVEELYRSELYNESFYGQAPHQEKIQNAMKRDLNALRVFLDSLS